MESRLNKYVNFNTYRRKPGIYQVVLPIYHTDGDMIDLYLEESPQGNEYIRINDFGMTFMRLSYTYKITKRFRQKITKQIADNTDIQEEKECFYLDSTLITVNQNILSFANRIETVLLSPFDK